MRASVGWWAAGNGLRVLTLCSPDARQNGSRQSARDLVDVLNATHVDAGRVEVVVAPPTLHLGLVQPLLQRNIAVCAQNVSLTGPGAFTGEIAAEQLVGEPQAAPQLVVRDR